MSFWCSGWGEVSKDKGQGNRGICQEEAELQKQDFSDLKDQCHKMFIPIFTKIFGTLRSWSVCRPWISSTLALASGKESKILLQSIVICCYCWLIILIALLISLKWCVEKRWEWLPGTNVKWSPKSWWYPAKYWQNRATTCERHEQQFTETAVAKSESHKPVRSPGNQA